ncbi:MAG: hypothetical protein QXT73_00555 [Candidatus Methanomethylicaceae archaeon]
MKRRVLLYGHLADEVGHEHILDVSSIGEALRALDANYPGFLSKIRRREKYFVRVGDSIDTGLALSEPELLMEFSSGDFHISPVIEGEGSRGKAIGMIILGIALVAVAFLAAPAGAGLSAVAIEELGVTYGQIALFGAGLALQGIVGLLTPVPSVPDYSAMESKTAKSYLFTGGVNLTQQGGPVPIVYGEVVTGSVVVSAGVRVEDSPTKVERSKGKDVSNVRMDGTVLVTPPVI